LAKNTKDFQFSNRTAFRLSNYYKCSNNIYMLYNLLTLTLEYCKKYSVDICADKTKLLLFADNIEDRIVPLNPIVIDDEQINFTTEAEHVGVIRSITGNVPNILNRILSSKKATNATLACGLARGHRSNPSTCLRVLQFYGIPVLMSGVSSLVLNPSEVNMIHQHHKNTVQGLQNLHHDTPQSFIFFLAGCLPATATLHLRQLSLFGMICRLNDDSLRECAKDVLITSTLEIHLLVCEDQKSLSIVRSASPIKVSPNT
jgi:hypothetical protein